MIERGGLRIVLAVDLRGFKDPPMEAEGLLTEIQERCPRSPWDDHLQSFLVHQASGRHNGIQWLYFKRYWMISMSSGALLPDAYFHEYREVTPQQALDILVGYNNY